MSLKNIASNNTIETFISIQIYKSTDKISIKGKNKVSISLAHKFFVFALIKYINILYNYICNRFAVRKIDLTIVK